jgi:hypothetical protein
MKSILVFRQLTYTTFTTYVSLSHITKAEFVDKIPVE